MNLYLLSTPVLFLVSGLIGFDHVTNQVKQLLNVTTIYFYLFHTAWLHGIKHRQPCSKDLLIITIILSNFSSIIKIE